MQVVPSKSTNYDLVEPDQDLEIRPEVQCNTLEYTEMKESFSERFSTFSLTGTGLLIQSVVSNMQPLVTKKIRVTCLMALVTRSSYRDVNVPL